jgi:hypothetical protein
VGHCFLAADKAGSAELAIFVHQEFRRRGVGTALVKAALESEGVAGLRHVWTLTPFDNRAALRVQMKCGFRLANAACPETEMEIPFPLGGSRRDESGAQDAEKCLHLLTPHFAYGHEMSFRIKCLCAVKVTANRQKKSANDSIPPPVNNFFRDAKISSGT